MMALNRVFSGVVKALSGVALMPPAADRRGLDTNATPREAHQRARKGLFEPGLTRVAAAPIAAPGNRAVQCREQRLNLAEFRRSFVSVSIKSHV